MAQGLITTGDIFRAFLIPGRPFTPGDGRARPPWGLRFWGFAFSVLFPGITPALLSIDLICVNLAGPCPDRKFH